MKANALAVCTLLAMLTVSTLACGDGTKQHGAAVPPITGYLTYSDEANGFSISYPENWNAVQRLETPERSEVAFVDPRFCCATPAGVSVVIEELPHGMSVTDYSELGLSQVTSTYQWYTITSQEQATLDDRTAIKHVYSGGFDRFAATHTEFYVVEGSKGWVVTSRVSPAFLEQYELVFQTMVNSFRLLD